MISTLGPFLLIALLWILLGLIVGIPLGMAMQRADDLELADDLPDDDPAPSVVLTDTERAAIAQLESQWRHPSNRTEKWL